MNQLKFCFKEYQCIGFDLDGTLAKYQLRNLIELEYHIISNYLVKQRKYPGDFLLEPIDPDFIQKGLIIDNELGNVLKIAPDGTIIKATHGTRWLKEKEILEYYPTGHRDFLDDFVRNPVDVWNGPYNEKMRISLDYFDVPCSLIFARAVDTVENRCCSKKITDIWHDIIDSLLHMFVAENFIEDIGGYYPELKRNPKRYFRKCSQNITNWLRDLKNDGKRLFLVTGAYAGSADLTAEHTLGENWQDYFDLIIFGARKPGFFTLQRDFIALNENQETTKVLERNLSVGGKYTRGNWNGVKNFMTKICAKPDPKFLYIGDNLIQDIYTPHVHNRTDTVCVSEELEAENDFGYTGVHPDKTLLSSSSWGSFFRNGNEGMTYWGDIMKKCSNLYVPSVDYLAQFPIDHVFVTQA